jgi:AcrR family transcriptional regulator
MSPRTSAQFEKIRAQSREKILDAALKLFAERGFHNTSVNRISKEAGVAKGLIYNYFDKKEDLLMGIVERAMSEGEALMAGMQEAKTPKKKLRFIIDASFDHITQKRDYYKLITALSLQVEHFPAIKEVVMGKFASAVPLFTPLLKGVGVEEPEKETLMLGALLDGIGLQYLVLGESMPIETLRQYLYDRYELEEVRE